MILIPSLRTQENQKENLAEDNHCFKALFLSEQFRDIAYLSSICPCQKIFYP
jgi:hypothetical protein